MAIVRQRTRRRHIRWRYVLILTVSIALALGLSGTAQAAETFQITQITSNIYTEWAPQVSGDRVVWYASGGSDGDADCSESCDEQANQCAGNDPNDAPCPGGSCQDGACERPENDQSGASPEQLSGAQGGGCQMPGGAPPSPRAWLLALLGLRLMMERKKRLGYSRFAGRGGQIRTDDPLTPSQVR